MSGVPSELERLWTLRQDNALNEQQYNMAVDVVLGITQPTPFALGAIPAAATPRWPRAELFSETPPATSYRSRSPKFVSDYSPSARPPPTLAQQHSRAVHSHDQVLSAVSRGITRSLNVIAETTPPSVRPPPARSPITTKAGREQARSHYQIIANARRGLSNPEHRTGCY